MALDSWLKKGGGGLLKGGHLIKEAVIKTHYPVLILLYLKLKKL